MINTNRIVPIQVVDLISMYGLILKQASANSSLAKVTASDVDGDYTIASTAGSVIIADQPVKSVDFASGYSSGVLYFVADYAYEGFSVAGTAVTTSGVDVDADGKTLYSATLASGAVTIAKVGF